jgi:hypothetical protein
MCKEHCGGAHPAYECRKKSTAALMEVQEEGLVERQAIGGLNPVSRASLRKLSVKAGTQALPVDTNSEHRENEGFGIFTSKNVSATTSAGTVGNKDRQTNSSASLLKGSSGIGLASPAKVLDAEAANIKDAHTPKRGRGRPKTITDMRAYKREKMREYRSRKSAN